MTVSGRLGHSETQPLTGWSNGILSRLGRLFAERRVRPTPAPLLARPSGFREPVSGGSGRNSVKRALENAAMSLLLIVSIAVAVRAGFAWSQARKIPDSVIGIVPFQTETGHIAYSVASGKGYSSPFER